MKGRTPQKSAQTLTFQTALGGGNFGPLPNPGTAGTSFSCDVASTATNCCSSSKLQSKTASVCTVASPNGWTPQSVTFLTAGTCTLNAQNNGNSRYFSANQDQSITVTSTVPLTPQTITFTSTVPATPQVATTYTVAATANPSLLPVTFSVAGPGCSLSGSVVNHVATGSCTITASQAGSGQYAPAPPATQSYHRSLEI
jgi:hypothetical protein